MIYVKTATGQQLLKERHGGLTLRQRSAFILFDGKRSLTDVLTATAGSGITWQDVETMVSQGWLAPLKPLEAGVMVEKVSVPGVVSAATEDGHRTAAQRFEDGYAVATALTAGLGLRGFRLNLAVEAARSYDDLVTLAPRIEDAVGAEKYEQLRRALFD